jgi:hypothetical protein
MRMLKENDLDSPKAEQIEFAFEHDKQYQSIQFAFMDAIDSMDHNNIIVIVYVEIIILAYFCFLFVKENIFCMCA